MNYKIFNLIQTDKQDGLFKIQVGGDKENLLNDDKSQRKVRIVSNTSNNNGIDSFIYNDHIGIKNCITIASRGNDYFSCYQDDYTVTIVRALLLYTNKFKLSKNIAFYICSLLRINSYKCSYGRVLSGDRLKLEKISLPVNSQGKIDFKFIEDKVKKLSNNIFSLIKKKPLKNKKIFILKVKWNFFNIDQLFDIEGSKSFTKEEAEEYGKGFNPYVCTSAENNGVEGFYNISTEQGNVLTIDSATIGSCFYQPKKFIASDHVEKLIPKFPMNKYSAMFIVTIINLEKFRYGYGRKFAQARIKDTKIKLPIDKKGDPNFDLMSEYIMSLPYSTNL